MTLTRTDSFVPLTSTTPAPAGQRTEFRATVISQPADMQKFRSIESIAAMPAPGATPHAAQCESKVTLQRDGDRVTGIHVQCSCGQVIDLACVYDAAPASATIPQPAPGELAPGKICKDSGNVLPTEAAKGPKVPEKGSGTSAAKRGSA
jgi:hypothetical protein